MSYTSERWVGGYNHVSTGGTAAQWRALSELATAHGLDTALGHHGKRWSHGMGPNETGHWLALWAFLTGHHD